MEHIDWKLAVLIIALIVTGSLTGAGIYEQSVLVLRARESTAQPQSAILRRLNIPNRRKYAERSETPNPGDDDFEAAER